MIILIFNFVVGYHKFYQTGAHSSSFLEGYENQVEVTEERFVFTRLLNRIVCASLAVRYTSTVSLVMNYARVCR